MGSLFALIPLAIKYGPIFVQIVKLMAPVLKDARPIFERLSKQMPPDEAAQKAVATAAPYIETPRVDPRSGMHLRPGALTVEEEMGVANRMAGHQ